MELRYKLPETRVGLSGVVEHIRTSFGEVPSDTTRVLSSSLDWNTYADEQASDQLPLTSRFLQDAVHTLRFTADRRLSGVADSTTSRVTEFVKAGVQAAVTLVALTGALADSRPSGTATPEQIAYDEFQTAESRHLNELRDQLRETRVQLRAARAHLLTAAPGADTTESQQRVRVLTSLIDDLEEDVDQALAAFAAWKDSNTTRRSETVSTLLEMRHLPTWDGSALGWSEAPPPPGLPSAAQIWDQLGLALARVGPQPDPELAEPDGEGVLVRIPRLAAFVVVRRVSGEPVIEQTLHRMILDDRCDREFYGFDRRWLGDREVVLDFDADGALIGVSTTHKDGVAAVPGALLDAASAGLAKAKDAVATLDGFATHDEAARKSRIDLELASAKAELELAGLGATRAEAQRVARLEQLSKLAAARKTIADSGAGSAADLAASYPDLLSWYRPSKPSTPDPQVIRLQIEQVSPTE